MAFGRKFQDYAEEFAFAIRATASTRACLDLIRHTLAFHWRNWNKSSGDIHERTELDVSIGNYPAHVTLRPRAGDMAVFYEVLVRDAYLLDERALPPESVEFIIDAGANIGVTSLYFAARYPNARIIAVEPHPENFALLQANASREPRITAVRACVTGLARQEVYITTTGPVWGYKMNTAGRGEKVRGASLAELMTEYGFPRIDLLKVHVEGAERQIFAHGAFLPNTRCILAQLHGFYDLEAFNLDLAPAGLTARASPHARHAHVVLAERACSHACET